MMGSPYAAKLRAGFGAGALGATGDLDLGMRSYNRLYTLLNVLPDADPLVIEAAYKALIKKHHPDKHSDDPAEAERKAADINHAFTVLRDPERRAAYDSEEAAQRERNRVELARMSQRTPPAGVAEGGRRAPPPNGFGPPARGGQRLAAWAGVLGVAVLAAALFLFARGPAEVEATSPAAPPVSASAAMEASPPRSDMLDQDELAFSEFPINRRMIGDAVAEFRQISSRGGLEAAADFSERCFEAQRRTRGISDFDYCVAFDQAASRTDLAAPKAGQSQVPRFRPEALIERHLAAADRLSADETLIEARLFEIRRAADAALIELVDPARLEPKKVQAAASIPSPRAQSPPRSAVRAPPRPRRPAQSKTQRSEDFLEREGGIY